MDIDLYRDDLAAVSDRELFAGVEDFTRVAAPATDRTQEGYLLDYKAAWSDSALRAVAAFANTFGGLLIVGVSESGGRADQLVGIASHRQELKTRIASAIASNISPTPPYDIRDIVFPDGSGKHLCLVRVRKGNGLYLLTKKGEQPVYVRNEDQSIPADAARLQALLATRVTPVSPDYQPFNDPIGFYVSQVHAQGDPGQRRRSETFLSIQVIPEETQTARLDIAVEQKLQTIVRGTYPGFTECWFSEARGKHWYQISYLDTRSDYEMKWGLTGIGVLHFITQVRCAVQNRDGASTAWSLSDLMTNLDHTIEAAHQLWDYLGYSGEGRVFAGLQVETLPLLERASGERSVFAFGHYDRDGPRRRARPLATSAITRAEKQASRGTAMVDLTYATRCGSHAEPVALLTNELLRDLGHSTSLADLRALL